MFVVVTVYSRKFKNSTFLIYRHSEFRLCSERIQLYSNRNEFPLCFYRNVHNRRCLHHIRSHLFQENKLTQFKHLHLVNQLRVTVKGYA